MQKFANVFRNTLTLTWSAEKLLCLSDLHADTSNYIFVIRRKLRYCSLHASDATAVGTPLSEVHALYRVQF